MTTAAPWRIVEAQLVGRLAGHIDSPAHQMWRNDADALVFLHDGSAVCPVC